MQENPSWTEEERQLLLKYLGNHLIAIVYFYNERNEEGILSTELKCACLSAFVISLNQNWYLVTAGHNLDLYWRPGMRDDGPIKIVSASMADYFGISPKRDYPLPFDFFDHPYFHKDRRHQEDLDYCVLRLNEAYIHQLRENIQPLRINLGRDSYDDLGGFCVFGFPAEEVNDCTEDESGPLAASIMPVHVPLRRVEIKTDPNRKPAFIAEVIDMGNQLSIEGMSGGPIFGYKLENGQLQYELLAIQSQWAENSKRVIGSPIKVALEDIQAEIRAQQELEND